MGFLDKLKETANMAKEKATEAVDQHGPQIKDGIGKAGGYLDKKTKGKYSDKIATGTQKAGEAVDNANKSDEPPGTPTTQAPHPAEPHLHEPHLHEPHPGTPPPPPAQPDQPL